MLKANPRAYWLVPAAALALMGCPDEELAPLEPCTVSGVSEKITQSGSDQLDLLFVIDDSASMEEEQNKLKTQLKDQRNILAAASGAGVTLPVTELVTRQFESIAGDIPSADHAAGLIALERMNPGKRLGTAPDRMP